MFHGKYIFSFGDNNKKLEKTLRSKLLVRDDERERERENFTSE